MLKNNQISHIPIKELSNQLSLVQIVHIISKGIGISVIWNIHIE